MIVLEGGNCSGAQWCNLGGAHGGGFYPDDGSRFFDIYANVAQDTFHWAYVWSSVDMKDMVVRDSFTDSPIYTNAAERNNVSFVRNTFVNVAAGEKWPRAALAIMQHAGPRKML